MEQETFLENPGKFNDAFNDRDFMMSAFRHVDLSYIVENGNNIDVELRKLIPSSVACVEQFKKMLDTDRRSIKGIFFLSGVGEIFGIKDLLRGFGRFRPDSMPLSREDRRAQRFHN